MCTLQVGHMIHQVHKDIDELQTGQYIFTWVNHCIKEIEMQWAVQVVTDNAASNKYPKDMMRSTRPR